MSPYSNHLTPTHSVPRIMAFPQTQQTSPQYLRYCSVQKLITHLQAHLLRLKIVSDLYESIYQTHHRQDQQLQNHFRHSIYTSHQIHKDQLIRSHYYSNDLRNLQRLQISYSVQINTLFSHLTDRLSLTEQEKLQLVEFVYEKLANSCQAKDCQDYFIGHKTKPYYFIDNNNYNHYLSIAQYSLCDHLADSQLYNYVYELTLKWICGQSQFLIQRCLSLIYEDNKKSSQQSLIPNAQPNQLSLSKSPSENTQSTGTQVEEKICCVSTQSSTSYQDTEHQQKRYELLPLIVHQVNSTINKNIFSELGLVDNSEIQKFTRLCCLNFIYSFSSIRSNLHNPNKRLDDVIFIDYPQEFDSLQQPVQQAVTALLNNKGGYIIIGLKKHSNFYLPNCTFKFSQNKANSIKNYILEWAINSMSYLKKQSPDSPSKHIKVDYIPIFKSRIMTRGILRQPQHYTKEGQFLWRITVIPDKVSRLLIHPINDKFYDLDSQGETYHQIIDSEVSKDLIYKKITYKNQNFGQFFYPDNVKKEIIKQISQKLVPKQNHTKIIKHVQPCSQIPQHSALFLTDKKFADQMNKQIDISEGNLRTKGKTGMDQLGLDMKKKSGENNEEDLEFKHVNLIVLQNKKIRDDCEKFLKEKRVTFKIQKLEKPKIKKLSKTTYIIHHHKKYEQMSNYLSEFKKLFNSNKKIILISAEKSVYAETILSSENLDQVMSVFEAEFAEIAQKQNIMYVEDPKEKKSFLKANNKLAGIYLYFILSELEFKGDVKIKMKNVPQGLQNNMEDVKRAANNKRSKQQERSRNQMNNQSNNHSINHGNSKNLYESNNYYQNNQQNYNNSKSEYKQNSFNYENSQEKVFNNNDSMYDGNSTNQYLDVQWSEQQAQYDASWRNFVINQYQLFYQYKKLNPYDNRHESSADFLNYLSYNLDPESLKIALHYFSLIQNQV